MTKNSLFIILACTIALASGLFVQKLSNTPVEEKNNIADFKISLPDVTGKQRDITEWKNKILIINFWATWCPPCLKEIPEFIKLQQQFNHKNIQFIGIAIDNQQAVKQYLATIDINYPILIGGTNAIDLSHQLGNVIDAVPYTLIVNQQGDIIHRQPGELSQSKILDIITPLFK
ncbi:MAG: TlpA family protein disulfide reductase [Methylococcales bacterium]|nr:TlpA family protein disulfide reductase [Methylococcales bacterium]